MKKGTLSKQQEAVYRLIPHGKENALSMPYIAALARISTRQLKDDIHDITVKGYPVAGMQAGYYIPESREEWEEYEKLLTARHRSTTERLNAVKEYIEQL